MAASATLPYVLFGRVAGAVADRVDRRGLMVRSDLANTVVLLSVAVAAAFDRAFDRSAISRSSSALRQCALRKVTCPATP